ncbi:MAG TPA: lipocalin family protein [Saprospiraceae bacterium]|nr:lipocalin family protein [Saprospiraceae bacterium]HMQ84494.1 lipocalin family protein [Saprospiraceae bacterium]
MKILKLLLVIGVITFFASCTEDDNTPSGGLVGTWKVTAVDYSGTSTTSLPGFPTTTATFTGTGTDMDLTITFKENPNEYKTSGDYSINLVSTISGQSYNQVWTNQGFISDGVWERNGNELIITVNSTGETNTSVIEEETDDKLVLSYGETKTETDALSGAVIVTEVEGTYTFEKQ